MGVFVKDPTTYLRELDVQLESALNPQERAQVDDAHLAQVNYEFYYFDTPANKERFEEDPRAHCGFVTDPITKQRFRPTSRSPVADFAEHPWFFVSDSTHTLFMAMPDSFLSPRYSMKPKPAAS